MDVKKSQIFWHTEPARFLQNFAEKLFHWTLCYLVGGGFNMASRCVHKLEFPHTQIFFSRSHLQIFKTGVERIGARIPFDEYDFKWHQSKIFTSSFLVLDMQRAQFTLIWWAKILTAVDNLLMIYECKITLQASTILYVIFHEMIVHMIGHLGQLCSFTYCGVRVRWHCWPVWPDGYIIGCIFGHYNNENLANSRHNVSKYFAKYYIRKPNRNRQRIWTFFQSGKISPFLVTLLLPN